MKKKHIIGLLGGIGLGIAFIKIWKSLSTGIKNWADSYENLKMDYEEPDND